MEIFQERRNRQGLGTHEKDLGQKKWLLLYNIILEQTLMLDDNSKRGFADSNQMATVRTNMFLVSEIIDTTRDAWETNATGIENQNIN